MLRSSLGRSTALLMLISVLANTAVVALAQTPYWDNSGGNQPYYAPPAQQNNTYNQPYSNYNAQPQPYGVQPQPYNQGYNNGGYNQQQQLHGYVSTAPAGTSLTVTNSSYLSSASARIGDPISVTLGYDLSLGGNVILPSGTQIQGQVVSSVPAGRTGKNGQLQLRFNSAALPDGRTVPLSARLMTQDGTGIIRGGTRAERLGGVAKNTLGGAALGAAAGTAIGALAGGRNKWNEGMMWGAVLGAGGGLARAGVQRGDEAEIQPGTQFQLMLDQPLNVNSNAGNTGYPY